jgi:PAS domain S-box-containing protein
VGVLPLWRSATTASGRTIYVVALLNPDAFANFQEVTLNDPDAAAALVSYEGRLIASTRSSNRSVMDKLAHLPPFTQYLPAVEGASWEGAGMREGRQIGAFRVLRVRPLMVLVEFDHEAVMRQGIQQLAGVLAVSGSAVLVVMAMTLAAAGSLRQREAARAERDAAQAEVAQRERELSVIFRSVQELLLRTDEQGVVTFINERWLTLTGQPPALAVGRPLADLVQAEPAFALDRLFRRSGDPVRQALVRLQGVSGRTVWLDLAVVPLSDDATGGFAASAVDVTGVQAAQAALKSQLVFTDSLLETNPLPVSVLDVAGRYLRVNRAWEDFFGRRRDVVVGTRAASYYPAQEAMRHDAQDRELISGRAARLRYEATHTAADGSTHELLVTKSLVRDAAGKPEALVCTFLDISEFREAERATREARDAAEETSRVKSEFIANISHELRTPLQSILGFSELGMGRGRDHPKLAGMFEDIHRAGQRMLSLVNDLLDVAKIESSVGGMMLERSDVRVLVREVVAELVPLCAPRGLRIAPEMPSAALIARVDPLRFQQVVRNVLANAIRFSPEAGTIELVATATAEGGAEIRVADRGPGIPPDETERIFEAFVQSSKTKDGSGGTGLGLAICRKIMEAHAGTVHAENRPGGGSVFTIRLPAAGAA